MSFVLALAGRAVVGVHPSFISGATSWPRCGWGPSFLYIRRYELAALVGVLEEFDARQPAGEERFYWLDIVTVDQNLDGELLPFQW